MHGPNAVGKTTFVTDVMKIYLKKKKQSRQPRTSFLPIFIDCVENYSEKLIAITISRTLDNRVRHIANEIAKLAKQLNPKNKSLEFKKVMIPKLKLSKFSFKLCTNFDDLRKGIIQYQELTEKFKSWFAKEMS
jgi:Cdc6-like AAA superfamily ATPase